MASYHKIAPGDFVGLRPNSELQNDTIDAIKAVKTLLRHLEKGTYGAGVPSVVIIKNTTQDVFPAFAPVALSSPIYDRTSAEFYKAGLTFGCEIEATAPTGSDSEIIGITRGAVAAGGLGYATVCGATLMKFTGSGSGGFLHSIAGDTEKMSRSDSGQARIISTCNVTSEGGDAYVLIGVNLGGGGCTCDDGVFACLDDDLEAEGYVTAKVWPDFEEEIEVYASPLMCDEDVVEKCTMVYAKQIGGDYYALIEGGKCNCNCEPYPDGYSVYAWLGVYYDYEMDSTCLSGGGRAAWPQDLYLECYKNDNRPANPGNSKNKKYLGIVATYADYNECAAAMNALNGQSQLIETILPSNDMTWWEAFINEGYRSSRTAADVTMATAAQIKGCQDMIESFACNTDCNTCQPQTCSYCNTQKTPGTMHEQIEVHIKLSHAGTVTTLTTFYACRNWEMGTVDGSGCCKNSTCFD